jgi:hypothetical protein
VTVAVAAGGTFGAVYLPHVIAVGGKVIGFLPGYLHQEGYTSGQRFGIIGLVVTGWLAIVVVGLILAAAALAVLQFSDLDQPWQGAVVMTAAALAVTTPHYQWYALLLVMLVALDGRPEWLAFAAGGYYAAEPNMGRYTVPYRLHDAVAYGVPVLVVAAGWLIRRELARRGAGVTEALPAMATVTAQAVPLTVLDAGEDVVSAFPLRPALANDGSRGVRVLPVRGRDSAFSYRLVTPEANPKRHRSRRP